MDVRLADGTIVRNVPDGVTKADLTAKLLANGYSRKQLGIEEAETPEVAQAPAAPSPAATPAEQEGGIGAFARRARETAAYGLREVGSTLRGLNPFASPRSVMDDAGPVATGKITQAPPPEPERPAPIARSTFNQMREEAARTPEPAEQAGPPDPGVMARARAGARQSAAQAMTATPERRAAVSRLAKGVEQSELPNQTPGETVREIGKALRDSFIYHLPANLAALAQGTDDPFGKNTTSADVPELGGETTVAYENPQWQNDLIRRGNKRAREAVMAPGSEQPSAIPGISVKDIREFGPNASYSLLSIGLGLVAGAGGFLAGGPAGGYAAGAAASGAAAYRMDYNQVMHALRESLEEDAGRPLTDKEWKASLEIARPELRKHGAAEGVFEGAGNALSFGIISSAAKVFGKGVLTRFASKLGAFAAGELGSEAATQTVQHNVERGLGMKPPGTPERSLLSAADWAQSVREVAPQVALLSGLGGAGAMAYRGGKLASTIAGNAMTPASDRLAALESALGADYADKHPDAPLARTMRDLRAKVQAQGAAPQPAPTAPPGAPVAQTAAPGATTTPAVPPQPDEISDVAAPVDMLDAATRPVTPEDWQAARDEVRAGLGGETPAAAPQPPATPPQATPAPAPLPAATEAASAPVAQPEAVPVPDPAPTAPSAAPTEAPAPAPQAEVIPPSSPEPALSPDLRRMMRNVEVRKAEADKARRAGNFRLEVAELKQHAADTTTLLERMLAEHGGVEGVYPDGRRILLTPGVSGEKFRVTRFGKDGQPHGHTDYDSIAGRPASSAFGEFLPRDVTIRVPEGAPTQQAPTEAAPEQPAAAPAPAIPSKPPATPAPIPSKPVKPRRNQKAIDIERHTLLPAIARLGGLKIADRLDLTGDDKGDRFYPGVGRLFRKNGQGLDELAQRLEELGYLSPQDLADVDGGVQALRDKIRDEFDDVREHWSNYAEEHLRREQEERDFHAEQARLDRESVELPQEAADLSEPEQDALDAALEDAFNAPLTDRQDEWEKKSEAEKEAELDALFGPASRSKPSEEPEQRDAGETAAPAAGAQGQGVADRAQSREEGDGQGSGKAEEVGGPDEYRVGDKVWHAGDEVTITSGPYEKFGGEWFDATRDDGKRVSLPSKAQKRANDDRSKREWEEQQAGFRRLRDGTQPILQAQTPDDLRAKEARAQDEKAAEKAIADREREAFTLTDSTPTPPKTSGMQDSLLSGSAEQHLRSAAAKIAPTTGINALADDVAARLETGEGIDWRWLFSHADERMGGTQAQGAYTPKDAYDAMELGVNLFIAKRYADQPQTVADAVLRIGALKKLLSGLPTQTRRTAEQEEFQQFSTPPPLAFSAAWAANIRPDDIMLDPSAGNGGLAVFGRPATVIANELAPRRAKLLKRIADRVFTENAEQIDNILPADVRPTVVLMNPPFSATAGRMRGARSNEVGYQHVESALNRLEPGGRAVIILGEGASLSAPKARAFWSRIQKSYNIRADIGVSGKEYAKYGTTFGNRLIIVDKTGPQSGAPLVANVERVDEIPALIEGIRNDRSGPSRPAVPSSGVAIEQQSAPWPRSVGTGKRSGGGDASESGRPGQQTSGPSPVESGKDAASAGGGVDRGKGGSDPDGAAASPSGEREGGISDGARSDGGQDSGSVASEIAVEARQAEAPRKEGDLTDSVYETYRPEKLRIAGAKRHRGKLVESAAMAAVSPPSPAYTPNLPKEVVESGKLSDAQLESVVYAGQAHSQLLQSGERRGFFIGDGTGVGKGREISGILMDNWRQGRKRALWISKTPGLILDAKRDFRDIGGDADLIFDFGKIKAGQKVDRKEGIAFLSYAALRGGEKKQATETQAQGKSRVKQIVEWLGEDFDGVIAFDEAHGMGNAIQVKGARGVKKPSQQALAGIELQRLLPKARVVYVSATGATEPINLAYANRLGLWGEGTAFPNVQNFVGEIQAGGLAAMELVSRDMKALGLYLARSLSYDGVTYSRLEHTLTGIQDDIYNELARAWQLVLRRINESLELTGQNKSGQAKSAAMSRFWGGQQRFFNQIITSMQMPSALEQIDKDIKAGNAVVLQLVNTNEAQQERALENLGDSESLEELDLTPRDQLIEYVSKGFPVQAYEEFIDENGNEGARPVVDAQGNPVLDRRAVAMRDELLDTLRTIRVPDGPLEMILNRFGPERVAEVTGRGQRVVRVRGPEGETTVIEKRGKNVARADAEAFLADKKPILVFSDAGGTGFSFHADRTKNNQRRRMHYLIQPGWRADAAVQGFGRTHRTNQASEPHYYLVTTNLAAQKRFISSIARRLDQLGALTKGQRQTGSQGLFSAKDNLESRYATEAIHDLIEGLAQGRILNGVQTLRMLGWEREKFIDKNGAINKTALPDVPQFLNRLLSLETTWQDRVFEAFSERMGKRIDDAISRGELDFGLETLRALKTTVAHEEVVRSGESGDETRYIRLELTQETMLRRPPKKVDRWIKNKESGKVWALTKTGTTTTEAGDVVPDYLIAGTGSQRRLKADEAEELSQKFTDISAQEGLALWKAENDARPKTYTENVHMLTGSLLPIWDRIASDSKIRVARAKTDDGRILLGRIIHPSAIQDVLKRVGAKGEAVDAEAAMRGLLSGKQDVELANGWRLARSRVAGEWRIEIKDPGSYSGFSYATVQELKNYGAFVERIQWRERAFFPSGDVDSLRKLFAVRPPLALIDKHAAGAQAVQGEAKFALAPEETDGFAQLSWLSEQAAERGYRDVDDLAQKAPQEFVKLAEAWRAANPGPVRYKIVYHGSPYVFTKFDLQKIGTGEGAQAYGWGLYLAESRAVAQSYASMAETNPTLTVNGKRIWQPNGFFDDANLKALGIDDDGTRIALTFSRGDISDPSFAQFASDAAKQLFATAKIEYVPPQLYTVDLPDEAIARMLDWDKPLSEQSESVKKALKALGMKDGQTAEDIAALARGYGMSPAEAAEYGAKNAYATTGAIAYGELGRNADASKKLMQAGIPGIRYLDGNSRGKGEGSYNYVIFDPDLATIIERNGEPVEQSRLATEAAPKTASRRRRGPTPATITRPEQVRPRTALMVLAATLRNRSGAQIPPDAYVPAALPQEVREIAKLLGLKVEGFRLSPTAPKGTLAPAGINAFGRQWINVDSSRPHLQVLGHEALHQLRRDRPDLYDEFVRAVQPYIDRAEYEAYIGKRRALGVYEESELPEEFYADTMGDAMKRPRFWQHLADNVPEIFRKLVEIVQGLISKITGKGVAERAYRDFDDVAKIAGEVMRRYAEGQQKGGEDGGAKLALSASDPEPKAILAGRADPLPQPGTPGHPNYKVLSRIVANVTNRDELMGVVANLSDVYEQEIERQRRGVVPWAATYAEAEKKLVDLLGDGAKEALNVKPGTAAAAAELHARQTIALVAAQEVTQLRDLILSGQATDQQKQDFLVALDRAGMVGQNFLGVRAEAGRALNILRSGRELADRMKIMHEIIEEARAKGLITGTHRTGTDAIGMLAEMTKALDAAQVLKFAKQQRQATTWDALMYAWKAALVSGPTTQVVNLVSNLMFAGLRVPVMFTAAAIGKVHGGSHVTASEAVASVVGALHGTWRGLKIAGAVLAHGQEANPKADVYSKPIRGETWGVGGKAGRAIDVAGEIIGLPYRALGAGDAIFREMAHQAELAALATRAAIDEGKRGKALLRRAVQLADNPPSEMGRVALEAGERYTFQARLGPKGRAVQNLVRAVPALQVVVPFIRTPANIYKEATRHSPLSPFIAEWRADFAAGGGRRDRAVAEWVVGSGVAMTVVALAGMGFVSGGGDPDKLVRKRQMEAGWRPYSIRLGDTWVDGYLRMAPVGVVMGIAADGTEFYKYMTREERDKWHVMLAYAFAQNVTNQTFMRGFTDAINAIQDPGRYGERYIDGLAGTAVPNIAAQYAREQDPLIRDVRGMLDAIKARVPKTPLNPEWNRQALPYKVDLYGEPLRQREPVPLAFSPFAASALSDDKVRQEATRLKVRIDMPERKVAGVELTPAQYQRYTEEVGKLAKPILDKHVRSEGYARMEDWQKAMLFRQVLEAARSETALPGARIRRELGTATLGDAKNKRMGRPVTPPQKLNSIDALPAGTKSAGRWTDPETKKPMALYVGENGKRYAVAAP